MKVKLLLLAIPALVFFWVMTVAVLAQEEVPAPYAELENPFPWDDASAQQVGEEVYENSCLGCHGIDGSNLADYDFSAADFSQSLEERQDFYYWVLSEGRIEKGMPAYGSSLSEEERWQVLTYLWSLGREEAEKEEAPPADGEAENTANPGKAEDTEPAGSNRLLMVPPEQAEAGKPFIITAYLWDDRNKPIADATVKFFIRLDFFTEGLMEIGEARTNEDGVAIFQYTSRQTGEVELVVSHEDAQTVTALDIAGNNDVFYRTEAGISLPAPGGEIFVGPEPALEMGEGSTAPASALRLPNGIISWFTVLVLAVVLIWATYFRVIYRVFGIPIRREIRETDTRLVPMAGLGIITLLGILLVLMLITGPYSNPHLPG